MILVMGNSKHDFCEMVAKQYVDSDKIENKNKNTMVLELKRDINTIRI
jgi:hypothetical protein